MFRKLKMWGVIATITLFGMLGGNLNAAVMPKADTQPVVGNMKGLVLRFNFLGSSGSGVDDFQPNLDTAGFERIFNDDFWDLSGNGSNRTSLYGYFKKVSRGKLNFKTVIAPIVTLNKKRADYAYDTTTTRVELFSEIIQKVLAVNPDFFNEAMLKTLTLKKVYAPNAQGIKEDIWEIQGVNILYPGNPPWGTTSGSLFFPSAGTMGNYIKVGDYNGYPVGIYTTQITPEMFMGTTGLNLSTVIHENGHLCYFDDFYDESSASSGLGAHCIMSHPTMYTPQPPNPLLLHQAGWIDFKPLPDSVQGLKISPSDTALYVRTNPANPKEFYIFEARHRLDSELTKNLPSTGLAVWHADLNMMSNTGTISNGQRIERVHYRLELVQAGGDQTLSAPLEGNTALSGLETDYFGRTIKEFSTTTTPNSNYRNGLPSGIQLKNITYNETNGEVTLDVIDPYAAKGDFTLEKVQFSQSEVLEGGNPVQLQIVYSGATVGTLLKPTIPSEYLVRQAGQGESVTLTATSGTLVFNLKTNPIDDYRNSGGSIDSIAFLYGEAIVEGTVSPSFKVIENTPPFTITATPSVRRVRDATPFTITLNYQNALVDNNETCFYTSYFGIPIDNKLTETVGYTPIETVNGTIVLEYKINTNKCSLGDKITSLKITLGENMGGNKVNPQRTLTIPLETPILYTDEPEVVATLPTPGATQGASKDYVRITWESDGTALNVLRAENEAGPWETIATGVTSGSFDDTSAIPGKTYYYKLATP